MGPCDAVCGRLRANHVDGTKLKNPTSLGYAGTKVGARPFSKRHTKRTLSLPLATTLGYSLASPGNFGFVGDVEGSVSVVANIPHVPVVAIFVRGQRCNWHDERGDVFPGLQIIPCLQSCRCFGRLAWSEARWKESVTMTDGVMQGRP